MTTDDTPTIWVLLIHHKHGVNVSLHRTEEGADVALLKYVDENWPDDEGFEPRPDDPGDRIEKYFEFMEDEYWDALQETLRD